MASGALSTCLVSGIPSITQPPVQPQFSAKVMGWDMILRGMGYSHIRWALRSVVSGQWEISYLEPLRSAWALVKQKSSAEVVCWNMEFRGGVQSGVVGWTLRDVNR